MNLKTLFKRKLTKGKFEERDVCEACGHISYDEILTMLWPTCPSCGWSMPLYHKHLTVRPIGYQPLFGVFFKIVGFEDRQGRPANTPEQRKKLLALEKQRR